jgi:hypothetical protein
MRRRPTAARIRDLGAQLAQHGFGPPSHDKVRASDPRRPAAELRQHKASHLVDHGIVRVTAHQFVPLLSQLQLQHLSLDLNVISVGLRARRLPPHAPQVSPMRLEAASAHCWSWVWKSQRRGALVAGGHRHRFFGSARTRRNATDHGMRTAANAMARGSNPRPIAPAL